MILNEDQEDQIGNDHIGNVAQNPIRTDAFMLSDEEKIESIKRMLLKY